MANKKLLFGILLMVLAFGMATVGCDNSSTSSDDNNDASQNPFLGTWTSSDGKIVFTETTFVYTDNNDPSQDSYGTYTYSGNTAKMTEGPKSDHPGQIHTITINNGRFRWFWFIFTKQS